MGRSRKAPVGVEKKSILSLNGIHKHFSIAGNRITVINGLSLELNEGEIVAITGKSGCGKSTLLNIITGITRPDDGHIILKGKRIRYRSDMFMSRLRNREIGQIFQTFRLLEDESVISNLMMPARIKGNAGSPVREYALEILGRTGMSEYVNTRTGLLSGGQKQRVAISRAIVNRPSLILADEPDANLDTATSQEIFKLLEMLRDEGKSILIVTHKDYMLKHADRTYTMENGVLRLIK
ncbi:MAG TPA: ABC transporter ATP-binding protein [Spirochaetota bacterium]|nr:ABC transporter ATP-binding protein [Spirochaetota bacterium]